MKALQISWYIESKGMIAAADKFSDSISDFIEKLSDDRITHRLCREPERAVIGFKCVQFRKKYTIVFFESDTEVMINEFIPSRFIKW